MLKAYRAEQERIWDDKVYFMWQEVLLTRSDSKHFPKTADKFLYKNVFKAVEQKKDVKGIDEAAIMAGFRNYQKQRNELKAKK